MLRSLEQLLGYRIGCTNVTTGQVADFLFVDDRWTVCWVVVRLSHWFVKTDVVLPANKVRHVVEEEHRLEVALTGSQVHCSPKADTEMPVARQKEILLARRCGWKSYHAPSPFPGVSLVHHRPDVPDDLEGSNSHLRSLRELTTYRVKDAGKTYFLRDALVDDRNWTIRGLVLSEGLLDADEAVIVGPNRVDTIHWGARLVDLRQGGDFFSPLNAAETLELRARARTLGYGAASNTSRIRSEPTLNEAGDRFRLHHS
jgi:hypothetical protein